MLANTAASTLANVVVFVVVPFLIYFTYRRWQHNDSLAEVARLTGLQWGERRYIGYCALVALALVAFLVLWPWPLDSFLEEGSAQAKFAGLGLTGTSIVMALLYGGIMTGFAEEFFFRGLIAGSLSRRLPLIWANLAQAAIFLLPHLLVLQFAPELWPLLVLIFLGALYAGWVRIKSGSIAGPWLIHSAANVTVALVIAARTVG